MQKARSAKPSHQAGPILCNIYGTPPENMVAQELHLKLAARHKVRPWGGGQFKPALTPTAIAPFVPEETQSRDSRTVPDVRPMHICLLYARRRLILRNSRTDVTS